MEPTSIAAGREDPGQLNDGRLCEPSAVFTGDSGKSFHPAVSHQLRSVLCRLRRLNRGSFVSARVSTGLAWSLPSFPRTFSVAPGRRATAQCTMSDGGAE
jgi:hypothetical protein